MANTVISFTIQGGPRQEVTIEDHESFRTFHDIVEALKSRGAEGIKINGFSVDAPEAQSVAQQIVNEFSQSGVSIRMNAARVTLDTPLPPRNAVVSTSGEGKGGRVIFENHVW